MARLRDVPVPSRGPRPFTRDELERIRELTSWEPDRAASDYWGQVHARTRLLEQVHEAAGGRRLMHSFWELNLRFDPEEAFYTEVTGRVYNPDRGECFGPGEPWNSAE